MASSEARGAGAQGQRCKPQERVRSTRSDVPGPGNAVEAARRTEAGAAGGLALAKNPPQVGAGAGFLTGGSQRRAVSCRPSSRGEEGRPGEAARGEASVVVPNRDPA